MLVPWIEWIQIYNVYFVRSDGLIIQSWKPAKAQGVFHSDILTRGDLKIIIPAIEKVIAEKMPRFVTYRIFSHPYIALLKPFPERHDEIIAHETADSCGVLRRRALMKMLLESADDLYRQLSYSKINRMHTNSGPMPRMG